MGAKKRRRQKTNVTSFDRLAYELMRFLQDAGGSALVVGNPRVIHRSELKNNFTFMLDFTGTLPTKEFK